VIIETEFDKWVDKAVKEGSFINNGRFNSFTAGFLAGQQMQNEPVKWDPEAIPVPAKRAYDQWNWMRGPLWFVK